MATYILTYQNSEGAVQTVNVPGAPMVTLPLGLGAALAVGLLVDGRLGWIIGLGVAGVDAYTLTRVFKAVPSGANLLSITLPSGQTIPVGQPNSVTGPGLQAPSYQIYGPSGPASTS